MKRHIAWLLSCGLLVGCAPSPPPIDEPSAPTPTRTDRAAGADDASSTTSGSGSAPAAFHFKSGVLEIGDFDPYTLGDDIFDPCTEISPEEFAAAGFHNVEPIPEEYAGLARGLSACEAKNDQGIVEISFMNNNADRLLIEDATQLIKLDQVPSNLPVYAYGPNSGDGTDCYVQIDTHRGGFVAIAAGLRGLDDQNENCSKAVKAVAAIYNASA